MNLKNNILLLFVVISFFSCDKKRVFDDYKLISNNEWNKDSVVTFKLPVLDAKKNYALFVNVRDNNDYPFSNLFLIVSIEQPNGLTKVDTLEYLMAEPDGTLLGEGFSDIKESKLAYKNKAQFLEKGQYKIHLRQAARETGKIEGIKNLKGITEVGFRIESLDK